MPLYFGLPVTTCEAFRIFDVDIEKTINEILKQKNWGRDRIMDCHLIPILNDYFQNRHMKLQIFITDKRQCVLGYLIKNNWDDFINVDQFIILLTNLKTQFVIETLQLNANLNNVLLEHIAGEKVLINNPIPYIISFP
jgi:hypothetical protein